MNKRIKFGKDDIIFAVHTSTKYSRQQIVPTTWQSLEINTVNSKIKNLQKLKSQILQDNEIVNSLRKLINNYDFNDGLLYEKLQKVMEAKK